MPARRMSHGMGLQNGQAALPAASIRLVAPAGMSWTATVRASSELSFRITCEMVTALIDADEAHPCGVDVRRARRIISVIGRQSPGRDDDQAVTRDECASRWFPPAPRRCSGHRGLRAL